jgi:DNA-directed RNA polymerase specialized sigma24 family protein
MDRAHPACPHPSELLAAFAAVMNAHLSDVARVARTLGATRAEAEDITQETFLALFAAMTAGRYDPSTVARAWLIVTAYRIGRRHVRKRPPVVSLGDVDPADPRYGRPLPQAS